MNYVACFMAVFSVIGGIDLIFGNRFGLGKEFQKGFMLFGNLALTMIGMIVLAPLLGDLMQPMSAWVYNTFKIDPSIIPSMILSADMGGAPLAIANAKDETLGMFNGLVVAGMMGVTISYTIPVALSIVKPDKQKLVLFGFLCGIITIPVGCVAAGIVQGINFAVLMLDLLPLFIFSIIISICLAYFPKQSVRVFGVVGFVLKVIITIGLLFGIVKSLTGIEIIKGLENLEEGGRICLNVSLVMSGAFPFLKIVSRLISKPLGIISEKAGINEVSVFGFFSTLATNITTFEAVEKMDKKGIVLNSAFAISAAFTFAGHLAFTMSFNADYLFCALFGKMISGIAAVALSVFMYKYADSI